MIVLTLLAPKRFKTMSMNSPNLVLRKEIPFWTVDGTEVQVDFIEDVAELTKLWKSLLVVPLLATNLPSKKNLFLLLIIQNFYLLYNY